MIEEYGHAARERAIKNLPCLTGRKISMRKHNDNLQVLFHNGIHIQNLDELTGRWYVFMLTGILPSFRRWKHHKVFYRTPTQKVLQGHNVFIFPLLKRFIWGRNRTIRGMVYNIINYDTDENSHMIRKIRDHIRFIPELGIFLGRFCIKQKHDIEEAPTFIGYFTLAPTFIFKRESKLAKLCKLYSKGRFIRHSLDE